MIRLENLSISFGNRVLIGNADAEFNKGKLTALIGRNGSGKSTLLRAMAGLNKEFTGKILIDNHPVRSLSPKELSKLLAFVNTQRPRIPNLSCHDVVAIGRAPYTDWIGKLSSEDKEIVLNSLRAVRMENYIKRTLDTMSDGECQRIMIARALAQDTPTILLDEPTSFLDIPNRRELVSLLANLAHKNSKCVIFSTHELDIALKFCDDIALIDNTKLFLLPVKEMLSSGHLERLFYSEPSESNSEIDI